MALGATLYQTCFQLPVLADQEGRALDPHVGPPVHAPLHPDAVRLGHGVVRVGQQREAEAVLGVEGGLALRRVRADADHGRGAHRSRARLVRAHAWVVQPGRVGLRVEVDQHLAAPESSPGTPRHPTGRASENAGAGSPACSRSLMAPEHTFFLRRRPYQPNHGWPPSRLGSAGIRS